MVVGPRASVSPRIIARARTQSHQWILISALRPFLSMQTMYAIAPLPNSFPAQTVVDVARGKDFEAA